ncbi:hypothetical protein PCL_03246 [Purpureocillium lilacinum]|uniref:Uncharacterized protein n=1 Tax=Purpureocillium lilacinum TaxID=33203 RepID=A0A2U3ENI9_PURLI|nr:hypothetical protein PCL_03246 [Purpureocillium lilacinum]
MTSPCMAASRGRQLGLDGGDKMGSAVLIVVHLGWHRPLTQTSHKEEFISVLDGQTDRQTDRRIGLCCVCQAGRAQKDKRCEISWERWARGFVDTGSGQPEEPCGAATTTASLAIDAALTMMTALHLGVQISRR